MLVAAARVPPQTTRRRRTTNELRSSVVAFDCVSRRFAPQTGDIVGHQEDFC